MDRIFFEAYVSLFSFLGVLKAKGKISEGSKENPTTKTKKTVQESWLLRGLACKALVKAALKHF